MLPGFRFLFATVVLAISVLVFGLGAAALLRAAHEEFVSLPSWRLAQQPVLTPQFEMSGATLAMLRVEALTAKPSPDKSRQQAIIRDIPRDLPDAKPAGIATQDSGVQDIAAQVSPPKAPLDEQVSALNAQAPATSDAPIEQAKSEPIQPKENKAEQAAIDPGKTEPVKAEFIKTEPARTEPTGIELTKAEPTKISASEAVEIRTPDVKSVNAKPVDLKRADAKAFEPTSSEPTSFGSVTAESKSSATEASEPRSTERIAIVERSSEATASATEPMPVVKKTNRATARAIRQRRAAIARARAEARAAQQQPRQNPDPFGLFSTAPRS